jgi:hypothetical protein
VLLLMKDRSSDDELNQDEKSDDNASTEVLATRNVDGLEINLERFHDPNIEILPLDKNAAQIVQRGHPLAKKLPLRLNLRPSASQRSVYHGVFTSFQQYGPVSVDALLNVMEVILDIKLVKVTCSNNNHVVKENHMVASWTKSKRILQNALPKLQDDIVGDDSLSSQLLFDQDINSDVYLNSSFLLNVFSLLKVMLIYKKSTWFYASQFMIYASGWQPMTPSLALTKTNP